MIEDPRIYGALKRLGKVEKSFLLLSVKGGVGKTTLSVLLALATSSEYGVTGLLDLDFVNPSTHVLLGVNPGELKYEERGGLNPTRVGDLLYFTIAPYTQGLSLPLHGKAARNLLWEVLSIVNWNSVKTLFIDTPPGLSDEHLELLYRLRNLALPVVVTTPSRLSLATVKNYLGLLQEIGYVKIFLVENMGTCILRNLAEKHGAVYAGCLPYIPDLEAYVGNLEKLKEMSEKVTNISRILFEST